MTIWLKEFVRLAFIPSFWFGATLAIANATWFVTLKMT
jgi:hypothetical protein